MLSRVAENIYWMGRYLERAENTARLVSVTGTLLLDQPGAGREQGWKRLVTITGCEANFAASGAMPSEEAVTRFLLSEPDDNPSSLFSSVAYARENLRAMRDIFPQELWEGINDLSMFLRERGGIGVEAAHRHVFLGEVIGRCQTLVGILVGTLSRGPAFDFFSMGQHMERADMCTRILDVDVGSGQPLAGVDSLWLNLLRSVSGEPMYRRHINPRINAVDVVTFLLRDRRFPRAFNFCLYEVERCLNTLDHNALSIQLLKRMERRVDTQEVAILIETGPGVFMDELQQKLQKLHEIITAIYF
ncbi:MAG: alpha-E domain-containing protein [Magnetococcales bacterium]|nr:alpha-E domain-containing protein [Magnetococcales bacterium]